MVADLTNYYILARRAMHDENYKDAIRFYETVLLNNPNDWEARFYTYYAQAELADPDSVFHYYRKLIALRKQYPVFVEGDFTLLEAEHPRLFVYRRAWQGETLLVVCNFSGEDTLWQLPEEWKNAELLLSNYPQHSGTLLPWEAKILYLNN